ncbi:MAG: GIY-YIG nuclease family protein [Pseudomonadota bacterium]
MKRTLGPMFDAAGITGQWVNGNTVSGLAPQKGAYVLAIDLRRPAPLGISKFAACTIAPALYVYLGSARGPGGIGARLKRHFRKDKALHWHIDHLTAQADRVEALAVSDGNECELQAALLECPELELGPQGFGSTDCRRCQSHLLRCK